MKRSSYIILALLLYFGMGARAGNVVTIGTASGAPGEEVTVSVSMTNTDDVAALQVSIPLNDELTFVNGSVILSSRSSGHNVTAGVKDGTLNIMLYDINFTALTGNEGEVLSFRLKLGNQPATIALTSSKLILTDTSGEIVAGSAQNGSVSIRCAKAQYSSMTIDFGSVPIRSTYTRTFTVTNVGNEPLEVTGLQFNNYPTDFSSTTQFPITINAGGSASINITYAPQERGKINETVKVVCNSISKLNNITLKAQPFAVNELHVQPASGIADEVVTVAMTMNNMDAVSGFQLEFTLPSELEFVANSFQLSDRKQGHTIVSSVSNGVLRIICYSSPDTPFSGEDGELATMQLKLKGRNSTTLKASKCLLTATIDNQVMNVCSADYGATITIRSPRISASSTLSMGATPVTEDAVKALTVSNDGNAPLTINRIVFEKEGFCIQESLPLTIASSSSQTFTVVYPSTEEGDYATTMQIYSNDPEQRLWNVNVTGNRFAPNYLSFTAKDVLSTQDLSIDVAMSNYDAINGIQFDVEYPSDFYEPTNELVTTARAAGLSVSQRSISANTVRYFFYSLSDTEIAAGEGKIFTFKLQNKANVPVGQYNLHITNIKLGTADMVNKYAGTDLTSTFNIADFLLGDVNSDGEVDAVDFNMIANKILGYHQDNFNRAAADINGDNEVDAIDFNMIANKILYGSFSGEQGSKMNKKKTETTESEDSKEPM
ncbi:MAG: choice-of-anchor D domain-containing protein [Bacteroidaceae bacterium]|nr:choice-of-anchor D domain-containing protein [Bacteroidaceae bacterium]